MTPLDEVKMHLPEYLEEHGYSSTEPIRCLNPLHHDESPSMQIDPTNPIPHLHCWSCNSERNGRLGKTYYSLIDVMMILENLSEKEAISEAFKRYGNKKTGYRNTTGKNMQTQKKGTPTTHSQAKSTKIPQYAFSLAEYPDFTEKVLQAHQTALAMKPDFKDYKPMADRVITGPQSFWYYLKDRGLEDEIIEKYQIGFSNKGYNEMILGMEDHPAIHYQKKNGKQIGPIMGKQINNQYKIILPYPDEHGKYSFFAAEIMDRSKLKGMFMSGKYHKIRGLKAPIFNERYIASPPEDSDVVVICEGFYDALSYEMAGVPAIGLIGVGHNRLLHLIRTHRPDLKFIIALDTDDAGQSGNQVLIQELSEMNIPYAVFSTAPSKDANEAWVNDREAFVSSLKKTVSSLMDRDQSEDTETPAEPEPSQKEEENKKTEGTAKKLKIKDVLTAEQYQAYREMEKQRENQWKDYIGRNSSKSAIPGLIDRLTNDFKAIPTGFANLDGLLQGGFRSGIWALGGMPGTGKSAWSINLAANLAMEDIVVIYVTIEMAKDELIARCLARETALVSIREHGVANAKGCSAIEISEGIADPEILGKAIANFEKYSENIFFLDNLESRTASGIADEVIKIIDMINGKSPLVDRKGKLLMAENGHPKYKSNVKRKPFVIVDYLQILDPETGLENASDKQIVDKSMKVLSKLFLNHRIPIVTVSSFNRAAYRSEASLESFKESGGIDGFVHGAMGLQTPRVDVKELAKQDEINNSRAGNGQSIEIELSVMKNRRGAKGKVRFLYYPKFDLFLPEIKQEIVPSEDGEEESYSYIDEEILDEEEFVFDD